MKRTFNELLAMMERNGTHVREQGRESKFRVNQNWHKGFKSIQQAAKITKSTAEANDESDGNTQPEELEAGEDGVDLDDEDLMLDDG